MRLRDEDLAVLSGLLDEALDLAPEQTEAWFDGLAVQHARLLPTLRTMLAERASAGGAFMAHGPKLGDDAAARAGDSVGPYRLLRQIGQGGMGAVWLAERTDGGLKRNIALKLPRATWGAGLVERMARERDIGALLEHPNIARLYEAGFDRLGRPYLALEYIEGQALDEWCAAHVLSIVDRLRLFLQIARAVVYAHARLVVHRDIKPSNILVDVEGQVHLLDFGIAKLLNGIGADSNLTVEHGRAYSPRYASPEQIAQETITVASDVYTLGVVLFEMLTGGHPYRHLGTAGSAREQAILDGDTRLASTAAADRATARHLRGELDSIVAKALKRRPDERYGTVDAFAADVERHLRGDTVIAQPDRLAYRLRKTVRRHRVALATTVAVVVVAVAGAASSLGEARRANAEAARAAAVGEFMFDLVGDVEPDEDHPNAEISGRQMVTGAVARARRSFERDPRMRGELLGELGRMLEKLGDAGSGPVVAEANALLERHASSSDAALNRTRVQLAVSALDRGRSGDAEAGAQLAFEACTQEGVGCAKVRGYATSLLRRIAQQQGHAREALVYERRSVAYIEAGFGASDPETTMAWIRLAQAARNAGQLVDAANALQRAERELSTQKLRAVDRVNAVRTHAALDLDFGRDASAQSAFARLADQDRRPATRAYDLRFDSQALIELGRFDEARKASETALSLLDGTKPTPESLLVHQSHARATFDIDAAKSLDEIGSVLAGFARLGYPADAYEVLRARRFEAEMLARGDDRRVAVERLESLLAAHRSSAEPWPLEQAQAEDLLGCLLALEHRPEEARSAHDMARRLLARVVPQSHSLMLRNHLYQVILSAHGGMSAPGSATRSAFETYRSTFPNDSPRAAVVRNCFDNLGEASKQNQLLSL